MFTFFIADLQSLLDDRRTPLSSLQKKTHNYGTFTEQSEKENPANKFDHKEIHYDEKNAGDSQLKDKKNTATPSSTSAPCTQSMR